MTTLAKEPWDGKERRRDLTDYRRLLVLYFVGLVVIGAVVVGGLYWWQVERDKDARAARVLAAREQRKLDQRLDARSTSACVALNEVREAITKNARASRSFLAAAEKRAYDTARTTRDPTIKVQALRFAAVYDRLAASYSILAPIDCSSAFASRRGPR